MIACRGYMSGCLGMCALSAVGAMLRICKCSRNLVFRIRKWVYMGIKSINQSITRRAWLTSKGFCWTSWTCTWLGIRGLVGLIGLCIHVLFGLALGLCVLGLDMTCTIGTFTWLGVRVLVVLALGLGVNVLGILSVVGVRVLLVLAHDLVYVYCLVDLVP